MSVIVAISGGKASAWCADWVLKKYPKEEVILYFNDKMTWDNYGEYWHIDHIKPQSLFNFESFEDDEFKECWALDNLQPLSAEENRKKSNKYRSEI